MLQARLKRTFAPGPESAGFSLDLEFTASQGVTVLFGPSGSGKTVALDAVAGFVKPDEGRILLDDQILYDAASGVHPAPQKRNCGYVFQNYALFPNMTLRQNLEFAAERRPRLERHRRVTEMLEKFRLTEAAGRRPHEVSGGQRQRCSIARALIGEPKLLRLGEFELEGPYFPGHLKGDRVTLCVRPEQLSAAARETKPGPNQIPAELARVVERPHGLRLEFTSPALSGGVRVNVSRGDYERLKDTREWVVQFPSESLRMS